MANSPSQDGLDQAAAAPHLRLRFDPPQSERSPELDHVIDEVEQLSLGIDTMLRRASSSAVGMPPAVAGNGSRDVEADDDDDDQTHEDEPMMAMFDEEQPSDIHALDRMLASHADAAIEVDEFDDAPHHQAEHGDIRSGASQIEEAQPAEEVTLEGDFEDIGALIAAGPSNFVPPATDMPVPAHTAAVATNIEDELESHPEQSGVQHASASSPLASSESVFEETEKRDAPPPVLDLSLAPTQAQGIAAALAAAASGIQSPAPVASHVLETHAVSTVASSITEAKASEAPRVAQPGVDASSVAAPHAGAHSQSRHFASIRLRVVEVIALTNLPMRMLPAGLRPMVNMLALSLALWAPAMLALGPRMAAARQQQHDAGPASHDSGHGDDAHGSSKHAESGHGGDSHAKSAEPKKSSSSKKKSSASSKKKSASKKSADDKADASHGGGH